MDPGKAQRRTGKPRPCLVAGCGYVGTRLARRLAASRPVTAISRSCSNAESLGAPSIATRAVDFDRIDPLDSAMVTAAHGAAIVYLAPPPETGATDPRLARFLTALGNARPAAFVYLSATSVYGDAGGATVTEQSPLAAGTDRGRRRIDAERNAIAWSAAFGVRCVILRVPGIYGPHRLPLARLRRAEPALRPADAGPGNRIHVDDLVSACVAAIDGRASGAFNVTDGDHASTTEYLQVTAELAGLAPPPLVSRTEAQGQISPGLLAFLEESRRVDNGRMRSVLGVRLTYPDLRSGIAASLEEMRREAR